MMFYMFHFTLTIIRHFLLQQFKNAGTFEHAIILLVRSHQIWLFIKIVNTHHIYTIKYPNYDVTKKKTEIKKFIFFSV